MCGKFTQMLRWSALVELADLQASVEEGHTETVTPMRLASVITLQDGRRRVERMRWGLAAPGAGPASVKPHIHARAETIDEKPAFRTAFRERRGLLVVTTFNEGREVSPSKTEQHVLTPVDGAPVAIAVIWQPVQPPLPPNFAMVTVPPSPLIATITDRMPALIAAQDWAVWLGEEPAPLPVVKALLRTSPRDLHMQAAAKRPPRGDQRDLF